MQGDGSPPRISTLDDLVALVDLRWALCEALGPRGVQSFESCSSAYRRAVEEDCYWRRKCQETGFAAELKIEDDATKVMRRVVLLEGERRASFAPRLIAALQRLGLKGIGAREPTETELRLLQWRHGFVLDRRYSRSLRDTPAAELERKLAFHPDTLPGHAAPSADSAAYRVANRLGAAAIAKPKPRAFPQRVVHLPLQEYQKTQTPRGPIHGPRGARPKLSEAVKAHGLDADSAPRLEELLQGRDLELCAMAPLLTGLSDGLLVSERVFSPPPLAGLTDADAGEPPVEPWDFFDAGRLELERAPSSLEYPKEARFGWQCAQDSSSRVGGRYHRMALFTAQEGLRCATPVERMRCTSLAEHGLRPAPPPKVKLSSGAKAAAPACPPAAAPTPAAAPAAAASSSSAADGEGEEEVEAAGALLDQLAVLSTGLRYAGSGGGSGSADDDADADEDAGGISGVPSAEDVAATTARLKEELDLEDDVQRMLERAMVYEIG